MSIMLLTSKTEAHNWMGAPGGRGKGASTVCRSRIGTDVQAQVGPGQSIEFQFSTGHGQSAWILVVPGREMSYLESRNKFQMAQEYLDLAPEGSNKAQTEEHKRWHLSSRGAYSRWRDQECDDTCSQADREEYQSDCWYVCTGRSGRAW